MWLTPLSATVNPKIPAKTKNTRVFFGFFRYFFGYTRVFRNFYQLRLVSAPAQQLLTTVVNTCFVFQHLPFNAILCFNVKTAPLEMWEAISVRCPANGSTFCVWHSMQEVYWANDASQCSGATRLARGDVLATLLPRP